ncbi:MAG: nuclease A inhibitor family protein [Bacteroidota bacterium]|nr:nuclease A inhibitor family protein [Candidatus Kapabacteria bacterium]MCS7302034.1 nuclease A inhibitor family protein [Candidatus Kapabacteria bacterium]MCX7936834.1 nuclease A inhibitor family protein [Chlorobiota bacterium]MDW8074553.1 nuclease A inhibitor family protein [Bacteroidota bacterium]MDW8270971.1 nuclease A inhibitor family protein [Bacteroidota bacterium]
MSSKATQYSGEQLYRKLSALAEGLLYPSETDATIEVFFWNSKERGELTLDALCDLYGISPEEHVVSVPPEDFFDGVTDVFDWQTPEERQASVRFAEMRDLFFANTSKAKHYWVGEGTVMVFLWGKAYDGNYVGFQTYIVET